MAWVVTTPITEPHRVAAIYRHAADLLQQRGWGRNRAISINGALCLTAAVNTAAFRPVTASSPDLMVHIARWLVENRADDLRAAYTLGGWRDDDPDVARVLAGDFSEMRLGPLGVVLTWNDAAVRRRSPLPARSAGDVVAALLAVADQLDSEGFVSSA